MDEGTENFTLELLYRDVVGEFSRFKNEGALVSCSLPHWVIPVPTLNTNTQTQTPAHSGFHFNVKRPKPFLSPSNVNPAKFWEGDPMDSIVLEKQKWEKQLDRLLHRAKRGIKWAAANEVSTSKVKKGSEKKHVYTVDSHMVVARHLEKDPLPGFSGSYNWFCNGGSATSCTLNEEKFLLYPCGEKMDTLRVTGVKQQQDGNIISTSLSLYKGQRIRQIVENKGLVGIKQENVCSLAQIKTGSKRPISTKTLLEIEEKDGLFVSIDLGGLKGKQMCTIDSNRILKLWDVTSSSCTANAKIPVPEKKSSNSHWSFVKFSKNSSELYVLDRSTVLVKDLRMPLSDNCMEFSPSKIIDDCEELSLLLNSEGLPLVYVGTSHQLLSLDTRYGWNQRWTHLMEAPPMYGSIYCDRRHSEEVILLSSSIPDDSIAIVNTWEDGKPMSESLPRSFHSLKDALILARSHGECLGISLKQRLDMATSGLTIVPSDNDGFTAFKFNSIGDIFYQEFVSEPNVFDRAETAFSDEETAADVKEWKKWALANDMICSQSNTELHCPVFSHNVVFNSIKAPLPIARRDPLCKNIESWHKTFPEKEKRKSVKRNFPYEHDSTTLGQVLNDLSSYTDLMANILLKAWDSEGLYAEPEPAKNVESWLGGISAPNEQLMDEDEPSLDGSLSSSVPQSSSVPPSSRPSASALMSMYGVTEADPFKVPATPFSQPAKKRKRESMGF